MFVPLHEYRVQRPIKIITSADAGSLHRFERIEHRAGSDRNAGSAQRAGEVDDVFGKAAFGFSSPASGGGKKEKSLRRA
jgi:hypothetical protein